jgi:lipid-binding SYLF domain-containing protein
MPPGRWEKTKSFSKKGFDKAWNTVDKLGGPVNRLSNRLGAEAFWPMTIDKESDKAARILRSFCTDGFYAPESTVTTDENGKINRPKGKQQRVIKKIPAKVLRNAKGVAIFTTMRTGLWVSGSGGSGVLVGRIPETGEWSPPSGIMLHTAGIGFLAGVDIYDCVVVINTYKALEAFKTLRCTLGGEVSVAAGPVGAGGVLESEVHKRQAPIWTYMKSKGLYAGVAIDGTIIIERTDENERFYGERLSVNEILSGKVRHPPYELETLMQTLKAAQGDSDVNESALPPPGETPGDLEISEDGTSFGVPAQDDPDPYGVKALEAEGLFIREAGTKVRPSRDTFEFRPNPGSPIFATFSRRSMDSSPRDSWRASIQSHKSNRSYVSVDRGTQTDDAPPTAPTSVSRASSRSAKGSTAPSINAWHDDPASWDTVSINGHDHEFINEDGKAKSNGEEKQAENDVDDDDIEVHEVNNAIVTPRESVQSSPNKAEEQSDTEAKRLSPSFIRARLVNIPARTPPALPPRHPQHVWGSGSSRGSTSPTALSPSSHNTSPTDVAEGESGGVPSSPKKLQTTTAIPAVVDDEEFVDTAEFPAASGDEFEDHTATEKGTTSDAEPKESTETVSPSNQETDEKSGNLLGVNVSPDLQKSPKINSKLGATVDDTPEVEETLDTIEAKYDTMEGEPSSKMTHAEQAESPEESPRGTKVDSTLPHARAD